MSLDQLSSKAGISRAYLWKLEKNRDANPSLAIVVKLAEALGIQPGTLINSGDATRPPEMQSLLEEAARCLALAMAHGATRIHPNGPDADTEQGVRSNGNANTVDRGQPHGTIKQ
jgi:transcriptional regulator with XRE-family HTH domain